MTVQQELDNFYAFYVVFSDFVCSPKYGPVLNLPVFVISNMHWH